MMMAYDHNNFIYYCIIFGIEMGQHEVLSLGLPFNERTVLPEVLILDGKCLISEIRYVYALLIDLEPGFAEIALNR